MAKGSKSDSSVNVKESLLKSIHCEAVTDNSALSAIVMQIIVTLYESFSESFEGILEGIDISSNAVKDPKHLITLDDNSVCGIRDSSAHNDFKLDSHGMLTFEYKDQVCHIDLNNWSDEIIKYRLSCIAMHLIVFAIALAQLGE